MVYAHARAPQPASRAHPHECRTGAMTSAMGAFACSIGRLSLGNMPSTEYTLRQRVALVLEASVTAETLVAMPDADIHHAFLMEHQASRPRCCARPSVTPLQLKAHGTAHGRPSSPRSASPRCTCWTTSGATTPSRPTARPRCSTSSWPRATTPSSSRARTLGRAAWASTWACCSCSAPSQPGAAREVLAQYQPRAPRAARDAARDGAARRRPRALGFSKARLRQDTLATDAQLLLLGLLKTH